MREDISVKSFTKELMRLVPNKTIADLLRFKSHIRLFLKKHIKCACKFKGGLSNDRKTKTSPYNSTDNR